MNTHRAEFAFARVRYFFVRTKREGAGTLARVRECVGAWKSVTGLRGAAAGRSSHRGSRAPTEGCRQVDRIILHGARESCKRRIVADPKPEVIRYPPNSIVDSSFNVARICED